MIVVQSRITRLDRKSTKYMQLYQTSRRKFSMVFSLIDNEIATSQSARGNFDSYCKK